MNIPDEILDFPVDYWQEWDPDTGEAVAFLCGKIMVSEHPDRRCKTGVRTDRIACHHPFTGSWETLREFIADITSHVLEKHHDG